jgi:hypothetical protein
LKKFFFFWKKPIDKHQIICYNSLTRVPFLDLERYNMNISYQNNGRIYSNNDIFRDYFNEGVRPSKMRKAADAMLAALSLILAFLSAARTRVVARTIGFGLCLIGFIGVIGAMEAGTISLGFGLILGGAILGIELLCLRRQ